MAATTRIVVADDERDLVEELQEMLQGMGYDVVGTAGTGAELVECCRNCRPDLVITDIRMPDMDGLQAGERIQLDYPVPLVVLSAYKDDELVDRAVAGNVYAYLLKPVNPAELAATIPVVVHRFCEAHPELRPKEEVCQWFG